MLLYGGLGYPLISSAAGMLWIVGRIFYSTGYVRDAAAPPAARRAPLSVWQAHVDWRACVASHHLNPQFARLTYCRYYTGDPSKRTQGSCTPRPVYVAYALRGLRLALRARAVPALVR